ncbi:hypothetical protein [Ruminococcus callidus]|uniref:hypothetical protein n=1 Tax=Ruminococcus callidus TaxID=40519 RepID=UPI003521D3D3
MRIYDDSFSCNLRVILESYSTGETRTLFFFCFFFFFSKESGESPLTLRPNFNCKKGSVTAGGESPLTLRPDFNCKRGSVTAAAAACSPRRGSFVDRKMLYLRVMHLPYSTGETRTLFFFCFFFSFQ